MIFTGFQPNATAQDIGTALSYLFLPWRWGRLIRGEYEQKVSRILRKKFSVSQVYLFDSGRSALEIALRALGVGKGDEVIVQAYTCVVVINAIRWIGATPIYVDVTDNFTIDTNQLEQKISPRTKVIIAQHTFGIPADIDTICSIAQKRGIRVIEDCAHTIGGEYKGGKLGTIGDIGMFSFGSDKVISCGRGGALIARDDSIGESIQSEYQKLAYPKRWWVLPYLWNFPIFVIGKILYRIGIGKILLAGLKQLSISGRVIYEKEKKGERSHFKVSKLANSLCHILYNQLETLDETNEHRNEIAHWYREEIYVKKIQQPQKLENNFFVRYPLRVNNPREMHNYCKKKGILLGDWYDTVIAPDDIEMGKTGYRMGDCPVAEKLAQESINLPTSRRITIKQADTISHILNTLYDRN